MMRVLYNEGDSFCEKDIDVEVFTALSILTYHTAEISDADDWSVINEDTFDGMHCIQLGEDVEGDSVTYIRRVI